MKVSKIFWKSIPNTGLIITVFAITPEYEDDFKSSAPRDNKNEQN